MDDDSEDAMVTDQERRARIEQLEDKAFAIWRSDIDRDSKQDKSSLIGIEMPMPPMQFTRLRDRGGDRQPAAEPTPNRGATPPQFWRRHDHQIF